MSPGHLLHFLLGTVSGEQRTSSRNTVQNISRNQCRNQYRNQYRNQCRNQYQFQNHHPRYQRRFELAAFTHHTTSPLVRLVMWTSSPLRHAKSVLRPAKREPPLALPGPLFLTCEGPELLYLTWRSSGSACWSDTKSWGRAWLQVGALTGASSPCWGITPTLASHRLRGRARTLFNPMRSPPRVISLCCAIL